MKKALLTLCLAAATAFVPATLQAESRTWTDVSGREVEGEILSAEGDSVVLRVNGREFTLPLSRLSEDDQAYIEEWKKKAPPATDASSSGPQEWPSDIVIDLDVRVDKHQEDKENDVYIYRSPHFEFNSNIQLSTSLVREFSRIFEATYETIKQLPVGFNPSPPDGHFKTQLFKTREEYFEAGGMENSAGVYMGRTKGIMIPLPNLGVRDVGNRFVVDASHENGTLKHEITHQVMHQWLGKTGVWFTEGWADYIEAAPYSKGRYKFTGIGRAVAEEVKDSALSDGREFEMVDLENLMTITQREWNEQLAADARTGSRYYKSAMILTYYFIHLDANENGGNVKAYLEAIASGLGREAATEKFFMRGRSFSELAEDLQKKWRSEGIRVVFPES